MSEEQKFLESIRSRLDEGLEHLDAATLSRLRQAREQALAQRYKKRRAVWLIPAGAAVAASILVALIINQPKPAPEPDYLFDELEMLSAFDELDLYEDLEFYAWLADDING